MPDPDAQIPSAAAPMPPGDDAPDDAVQIEETAVGILAGARVGAGNLWPATYTRADGTTTEGMTAQLFLLDDAADVIVGAGSVVRAGGADWTVVAVEKPAGAVRGRVMLHRAGGAGSPPA